jgi:catechol 2,3-dioxygenase-like lactoylglutathione lyase family enzyme
VITGFSHTGVVVKDMEKMITFYRDTFGFQVILDTLVSGKETDDIVNFQVERENRSHGKGANAD